MQSVKKEKSSSLFAVVLIKHAFDQATRSKRIIEVENDVTIRLIKPELAQDEWFCSESASEDQTKTIIKIVSQDDTSQKINFYEDIVTNCSIAGDGEDVIQVQTPYYGKN